MGGFFLIPKIVFRYSNHLGRVRNYVAYNHPIKASGAQDILGLIRIRI